MRFEILRLLGGPIPSEHKNYNLHVHKLFKGKGLPHGRCFGSKSGYWMSNKDHITVFNANVLREIRGERWKFWVRRYEKIWYGDLDITLDEEKLKELARELKCRLVVLRENDARFDTEEKPRLERAVFATDGNTVTVNTGSSFSRAVRNSEGRLVEENV